MRPRKNCCNTTSHGIAADSHRTTTKMFSDYLLLMKPELTTLSVFSAVACAYLALPTGEPFPVLLFVWLSIGTLLAGGGAGALNQYLERQRDAEMKRTQHRPLASGRLFPREGLAFGLAISFLGIALLAIFVNPLSAIITAATIGSYIGVYTPLKQISSVSTIVGAIPGALPALIGWTAIRNDVSIPAMTLFAIVYYWQMPHFYALAWLYRIDYMKGGFKLLSTIDASGAKIVGHVIVNLLILLVVGCLPYVVGLATQPYLYGAAAIGLVFLAYGVRFARSISSSASQKKARQLFFASLAYLPVILMLLIIFKH